ncbi:MAG: 6-pyruvoyl tetrahydrobiopterin synthase [Bacteroidetes bacterium GWA2_31_9b]|nr:MAG: 6-pyruvoyl tetrahydrobiopterin synthase [Bacteroidetes bacterium GWA2_31_9b]
MVFITRREQFSAAHRLFKNNWDDEKNLEVFGQCSNPNWHGHNYVLFITVKGDVNPETGFVVNIKKLSAIIRESIISKLDHKNINIDVDFMRGKLASTEYLAISIWEQLEASITELGIQLHCVKLMETENNYIEYYGN